MGLIPGRTWVSSAAEEWLLRAGCGTAELSHFDTILVGLLLGVISPAQTTQE